MYGLVGVVSIVGEVAIIRELGDRSPVTGTSLRSLEITSMPNSSVKGREGGQVRFEVSRFCKKKY
jgi:hypothetical protein